MKYVVLVPDGAADRRVSALGGVTPLEAAHTPNMDQIAKNGVVGTVQTVPEGAIPGSDVANVSILGYDPLQFYTGRGPLEAGSRGIDLKSSEHAFRCNLITVDGGVLTDYSAGHISTEEGAELIADLDAAMKDWPGRFVPGVSYRHLLIIEGDFDGLQCVPPHNAVGDSLDEAMPGGDQGQLLREMMAAARPVLENHPVNRARREKGLNPANMIWLWGQGRKPAFPSFMEKYGVGGAIISAVDLIKGIGHFAGLETPHVPGATAYFDTDLEAKTSSALAILKRDDFCFVHVEAPDEAGHTGQVATKVEMIENFDRRLVGPILAWLEEHGVFRVVVVPDHATPVELRVHTAEAVPFALYATGGQPDAGEHFSEVAARSGSVHVAEGHRLMDLLIRRSQD